MTDATRPIDPNPDGVLRVLGVNGSLAIDGTPGDVVPVTLDAVEIDAPKVSGVPIPLLVTCHPLGDPIVLGQVTVAGTTLVVPDAPAYEGDELVLSAHVQPVTGTGMVVFSMGETTLGVALVDAAGNAQVAVTGLPVGTHEVTARYVGSLSDPSTSDTATIEVANPPECRDFAVEGNPAVVRLVYLELLGRCPDQAGFDYWVGQLDSGTSPEVFARAIAATPEAVGRVVDDGYRTMLGRPADSAGRAFWTGRLQGHGRYDQLLADLGASDEFWTRAGSSDTGFVTRVYERLLNRAPDQAGLDYWTGRLAAGTSRRALILSLANQDEPLSRLVTQSYDAILDRAPDGTEPDDGITFLRRTGDRSALYAELIGRPEFSTRAQGFPNP